MKFEQSNKNSIKFMFNQIAMNYDVLNTLMSFGLQKIIKKKSVNNAIKKLNHTPLKILDLCTGTGDIAIECEKKFPNAKIIGVDFSDKMLEIAMQRSKEISFLEKDITDLGEASPLEKNSFDICFISFGLRNLPDADKFLTDINNYLKPDGVLSVLDLGKPSWYMKPYFFLHYELLIPLLSLMFNRNNEPYKYLINSAKTYFSQAEIIKKLKKHGFVEAENINYAFGIISQQLAKKIA